MKGETHDEVSQKGLIIVHVGEHSQKLYLLRLHLFTVVGSDEEVSIVWGE